MKRAPSATQFRALDVVRLLGHDGPVPAGAVGRIIGEILWPTRTYLVSLEGEVERVAEVRSDEIVLANDLRASA